MAELKRRQMRPIILRLAMFIWGIAVGSSALYMYYRMHEVPDLYVPVIREHGYEVNEKAVEMAEKFTVLITHEGFGVSGRGTGIIIDPTHVLTCAHLMPAMDMEIWVYPYPGEHVIRARAVFSNRRNDLAIFELEQPVTLAEYPKFEEKTHPAETITIIGNTLGSMKWFVSYGVVGGYQGVYLLTDGLVKPGNSGGPWINSAGAVVAITDWSMQSAKGCDLGVNGGVGSTAINKFLKAWKNPSLFDLLLSQGPPSSPKSAKK